jgi:hypothetical protein
MAQVGHRLPPCSASRNFAAKPQGRRAPNGTSCAAIASKLRPYARLSAVRRVAGYLLNTLRLKSAKSLQREYSSWLSLATRSKASLGFLMRYW